MVAALIGLLLPEGQAEFVIMAMLLLSVVFWFIALPFGATSGFRIGCRFSGGQPLSEGLRSDYLVRLSMIFTRFVPAMAIEAVVFLVPFLVIFGIVTLVTDLTFQVRLIISVLSAGVLLGGLEAFEDYWAWRKRVLGRL